MEIMCVTTTCPYCGAGCSFNLVVKDGKIAGVQPCQRGPVNEGKLCPTGIFGWEFIESKDRLKTPMIKDKATDKLKSASWDEALTIIVENFNKYNPNEI
ncbi:MAG TPA: molybdopterin-dependent oxidoreductase, partial [Methanocorpusculum sp.]|nr:molybdopterin-dependent oxidoreductase [Methanocorpusculum sp.]